MEHRRESLLQLKMFLLARTSALALLVSLMAGTVTTATATAGLTCRQEIPAQLIRNLWSRTKLLISRLPKEENFHRRHRLLPNFCIKCEDAVGWLEMKEVIDIYERNVFRRKVVQNLLPEHYNDLLYRLHHTLQHCVSSSGPSKRLKLIRKLEKKIKKRKRDEGALKAVAEFTFILRWIDELAQHHNL